MRRQILDLCTAVNGALPAERVLSPSEFLLDLDGMTPSIDRTLVLDAGVEVDLRRALWDYWSGVPDMSDLRYYKHHICCDTRSRWTEVTVTWEMSACGLLEPPVIIVRAEKADVFSGAVVFYCARGSGEWEVIKTVLAKYV